MDDYSFEAYCNETCSYYKNGRCDFHYGHPNCDKKEYSQRCDLEYYIWTDNFSEGGWE